MSHVIKIVDVFRAWGAVYSPQARDPLGDYLDGLAAQLPPGGLVESIKELLAQFLGQLSENQKIQAQRIDFWNRIISNALPQSPDVRRTIHGCRKRIKFVEGWVWEGGAVDRNFLTNDTRWHIEGTPIAPWLGVEGAP